MNKLIQHIRQSIIDIFKVWRREFRIVFTDLGVLIFFLLLPVAYPIVYSLIYNPEVAREVPVVIVDNDRSEITREYTRQLDATPYIKVANYAANLQEAKRMMDTIECYGIMYYLEDFTRQVGCSEHTTSLFYSAISIFLSPKCTHALFTRV